MHGSFDRSGETDNRIYRRWGIGVFALPVLLVIALVGLAIAQPSAQLDIGSGAGRVCSAYLAPETAPAQIAQPAREIRTVRAN